MVAYFKLRYSGIVIKYYKKQLLEHYVYRSYRNHGWSRDFCYVAKMAIIDSYAAFSRFALCSPWGLVQSLEKPVMFPFLL